MENEIIITCAPTLEHGYRAKVLQDAAQSLGLVLLVIGVHALPGDDDDDTDECMCVYI